MAVFDGAGVDISLYAEVPPPVPSWFRAPERRPPGRRRSRYRVAHPRRSSSPTSRRLCSHSGYWPALAGMSVSATSEQQFGHLQVLSADQLTWITALTALFGKFARHGNPTERDLPDQCSNRHSGLCVHPDRGLIPEKFSVH